MKYLFLSILMIGVGMGVVGCEDDDKDPPEEEVVEEEAPVTRTPEKWDPDISGLWSLSAVDANTNGTYGAGEGDIRILQTEGNISVEYIDFLNPTSPPSGVSAGYVTKEYDVFWNGYSGIINEDASRMRGTNIFTWGTSTWGAVKLPDNWIETLNAD